MADVAVGDSLTMMVESILSRPTTLIELNAPLPSPSSALRGVSWSLAAHTSAAKGPGTRSAVAPHQDQEGWVCRRHYIHSDGSPHRIDQGKGRLKRANDLLYSAA